MPPGLQRTSHASAVPSVWILLATFAFVLVAAVLYEVIPRSGSAPQPESLVELKVRLEGEEKRRRDELQKELDEWQQKNETLRGEIERLKGEKK